MAETPIERYLGGGRVYFEKLNADGTHEEQREIGEIQNLTISVKLEKEQAFSQDDGPAELVMELEKKKDMSLKFATQNVDKNNLALVLYGTSGTNTYAIGETLPNGEVATVETIVPTIQIGTSSIVEGRFVFISNAGTDKIKRKKWTFNKVSLSMEGDFALMSDKFVTIPMTATVLKDKSVTEGSQYGMVEDYSA